MTKRSLRIVCYAVNGSGVGHLVRQIAIARWLRRYARWLGVRPEVIFLTSSEADGLLFAERFASFKLPSKTAVADAGLDKTTYLALAKQWVWHSLGLLRPDLFVVDTFPRGSFGELLSALDLCKKKALVYRPMLEGFAQRADVQAMLPLYDAILVPEPREADEGLALRPDARARARFVGTIAARDLGELLPRAEARASLGLAADARVALVSAGGGGDPTAEAQLHATCDALLEGTDLHVVVGAGPLYRGKVRRGPRVTWLSHEVVAELVRAFDVAVTAAGYNSFAELMLGGVPAVFVPQRKVADDQRARAERARARGAARALHDGWQAADLVAAVEALLADRRAASEAARALVPRSHARDAAAELLRLVLPHAEVDRAEAAVTDAVVAEGRALGVPAEQLVDVMLALGGAGGEGVATRDLPALAEWAARTCRAARGGGAAPEAAERIAAAIARSAPGASLEERASAASRALAALAPFGEWDAAAHVVTTLGRNAGSSGGAASAARLAEATEGLATALAARGGTLVEAARELAGASRKAEAAG